MSIIVKKKVAILKNRQTTKDPQEDRPNFILNTATHVRSNMVCTGCGICFAREGDSCPFQCNGLRSNLKMMLAERPRNTSSIQEKFDFTSFMKAKEMSTFCLEPFGDTVTRRSFYEDILQGCVPVVFRNDNDYLRQMAFNDAVPYRDIWVHIPHDDVHTMRINIVDVLMQIPADVIQRKRELMRDWVHVFLFHVPDTRPLSTPPPPGNDPPQGALARALVGVWKGAQWN